jgi:hypothetical protein
MKERLIQEENNSEDLDLVIDRLSKSRNKPKSSKMVASSLGDMHITDLSFLSVLTLLSEKWSLQQEKMRDFFVGNPSPVCNSSLHSQVGFEATTNPSPQEVDTNHQPTCSPAACNLGSPTACNSGSPAACKDPPPPPTNMPFGPMAFLKEWGKKMQMIDQHQPQTIVVESRVDKSHESEAKFNNHMLQLL